MSLPAVVAAASVLCGCQLNVLALEQIVGDPQGKSLGITLTLLQFGFTALLGFPELLVFKKDGWLPTLAPRKLDARMLLAMSVVFTLSSVTNNAAFGYDISVPLHTVFRSSSLIVNMLVGYVVFGRTYSLGQTICACCVTGGLAVLTLQTSRDVGSSDSSSQSTWLIGMSLLVATTLLSAGLGILQDAMYREAGKAKRNATSGVPMWKEAMVYSHLLAFPLLLCTDVSGALKGFSSIPHHLWGWLAVNIVTQYFCIRGVYSLTETTTSFVMTMTITIRKTISLIVSIFYFGHYQSFGPIHWISIALVMISGPAFPFVGPKVPTKGKKD